MATILVVDDHPTNRDLLVTVLGYGGHTTLEASDGEQALALAKAERPDLIISDIVMPSMDGYELTRRLREDPEIGRTPVIFHSAHFRMEEARVLASQCGVQYVIPKPCDPASILAAVANVLADNRDSIQSPPADEFDRAHVRILTDQ